MRSTVGKRESGIQSRASKRILKEWPDHSITRVKHGSAYAIVGDPDIYGCVYGRMFVLEVKNEDGLLTKIQMRRLQEFAWAGAIVGAIQDPEEAIDIIKNGLQRG